MDEVVESHWASARHYPRFVSSGSDSKLVSQEEDNGKEQFDSTRFKRPNYRLEPPLLGINSAFYARQAMTKENVFEKLYLYISYTMTEVQSVEAHTKGTRDPRKLEKKRKRGNDPAAPESNGASLGSIKLSKEERREAKRLKAIKEESDAKKIEIVERPLSNGEGRKERSAAKAARNAEKARLKTASQATKEGENKSPSVGVAVLSKDDEAVGGNKTLCKAKKARTKAERKAERKNSGPIAVEETVGVNGHAPKSKINGESTGTSAYTEDPALTALAQFEVDEYLSSNAIIINDPTTTDFHRPIMKFSNLPSAITSEASPFTTFKSPTPIQAAAWPFLLSGRDVVGVAETGSGKTLAFGVPCVQSITSSQLSKSRVSAKAVIVSPTRELAVQIHTQIEQLATPFSLSTVCVYGGVPKDEQRTALRKAAIIVATPGRLNDLIEEGSANLSHVKYLVLDEADRMLDKGFEDAIRIIISQTSTLNRQTLMFTATWPPSVRELAATFMHNPVHIAIGAHNPTGELRANNSITQIVEVVDPRAKEQRLLQILKQYQSGPAKNDRILVFCLYKKEAARVETMLRTRGFRVAGIHGDMSQTARSASFTAFKSGAVPLLVATDVAARGWDIPAVKMVVNVTFPLTTEDYVHRIGRTGRAGEKGVAVTLFTELDKGLAGGLVNVLKAAGQTVPEDLLKFGTTVKKKGHEAYGAFYKDVGEGEAKKATKIKFDD
ncbi:RNA-dependent ATPase [Puttea exsequens]|nr:RNA-dependent ATPase [Puttea exsequens]